LLPPPPPAAVAYWSRSRAQRVASCRVASASYLSMRPHLLFDCCIVVHVPSCCAASASRGAVTSFDAAASCPPTLMPKESHPVAASHPPVQQPRIAPPFLPPPSTSRWCLVVPILPGRTFIFGGAKLATVAGLVFCNRILFVESYFKQKQEYNLNRVDFGTIGVGLWTKAKDRNPTWQSYPKSYPTFLMRLWA
jgi:hypothetical protein